MIDAKVPILRQEQLVAEWAVVESTCQDVADARSSPINRGWRMCLTVDVAMDPMAMWVAAEAAGV